MSYSFYSWYILTVSRVYPQSYGLHCYANYICLVSVVSERPLLFFVTFSIIFSLSFFFFFLVFYITTHFEFLYFILFF